MKPRACASEQYAMTPLLSFIVVLAQTSAVTTTSFPKMYKFEIKAVLFPKQAINI